MQDQVVKPRKAAPSKEEDEEEIQMLVKDESTHEVKGLKKITFER
jgi:hypothetical protein